MNPKIKTKGVLSTPYIAKKPLNVKRFIIKRSYLLRSPYIQSKKKNQEDIVQHAS